MLTSILLEWKLRTKEAKNKNRNRPMWPQIRKIKNHTMPPLDTANNFLTHPREILGPEARWKTSSIEPHHFIFKLFVIELLIYVWKCLLRWNSWHIKLTTWNHTIQWHLIYVHCSSDITSIKFKIYQFVVELEWRVEFVTLLSSWYVSIIIKAGIFL